MQQTKKDRRNMDAIRNNPGVESAMICHTPNNVIVPIKLLWTAIAQMRERNRPGVLRPRGPGGCQLFGRGIAMTEAYADPQGNSAFNRLHRAFALRGYGEE